MEIILGVDGGATKTAVSIGDINGNILGFEEFDDLNYQLIGIEEFIKRVDYILNKISKEYMVKQKDIKLISMGLAGVNTPIDKEKIEEAVNKIYPKENIILNNDSIGALMAGTGKLEGIVLISGTGSIAYGVREDGKSIRAGGWGHIVSDEGSGYYIGRKALAESIKSLEKRSESTILFEEILNYLRLKSLEELIAFIYNPSNSKKDIAVLSKVVVNAAKKGDKTSLKILNDSAAHLASLVHSVHIRLFNSQPGINVVLSGSILKKVNFIQREVIKLLKNNLTCIILNKEPAIGFLMLGYKHLKHKHKGETPL